MVLASAMHMASARHPLIRSQSEHISGRGVASNAAVFPPLAAKEAGDPAVLVIDSNGEMVSALQLPAAKAASIQGPHRYPQHWRRAPKATRPHGNLTEVFRKSFMEVPGVLSQDSFREMQLPAAAAPVPPLPATAPVAPPVPPPVAPPVAPPVPPPVAPPVASPVGVAAPVAPVPATAPLPALAATAAPLLTATPAPVAGTVVTPAPVPGAAAPLAAAAASAAPTATAKDDSQGGSGTIILIVFLLLGTLAIAAGVLYKKRLGNAAGGRLGGIATAGAEDPLVWKSTKSNKSTYRKAVLSENKTSQDTEDSDEDSSAKPSGEDQKSTAKTGRGAAAKASRAASRDPAGGDDAAAAAGSTASEKELGSTGGSVTGTAYRSYKDRRAKS